MDHNEILHALADYLDESLGPKDRAAVEEHLKTCSSCAVSLVELRKTLEYVRRLEKVYPPAWMTQKIMARVREDADKKKEPAGAWLFRGFRFPVGALGVVFLTVTAFIVYRNMQPVDQISERAPVQAEAPAPATAQKDESAKSEVAPPPRTVPQTPVYKAPDIVSPAPPVSNKIPAPARQAAPARRTESAAKPSVASEVPRAPAAGAIQKKSTDLSAQVPETTGTMLLIRIRSRGNESLARIEEAIRAAGGAVVSRDVSSDAWVMTLQIAQSKHEALLNALQRFGKTEERILAIDGQEGREILMRGSNRQRPAAGC